jgi:hypothetical protein
MTDVTAFAYECRCSAANRNAVDPAGRVHHRQLCHRVGRRRTEVGGSGDRTVMVSCARAVPASQQCPACQVTITTTHLSETDRTISPVLGAGLGAMPRSVS